MMAPDYECMEMCMGGFEWGRDLGPGAWDFGMDQDLTGTQKESMCCPAIEFRWLNSETRLCRILPDRRRSSDCLNNSPIHHRGSLKFPSQNCSECSTKCNGHLPSPQN